MRDACGHRSFEGGVRRVSERCICPGPEGKVIMNGGDKGLGGVGGGGNKNRV